MRKFLSKTMILAVLAAIFLTVSAFAAEAVGTGIVSGDALRLRSEPSTESATLTLLSKGTKVQVYEVLDGWYKVTWNERTGYLSADYLTYTPADAASIAEEPTPVAAAPVEASAAAAAVGKTGLLTVEGVNFRANPSTEAEVLDVLEESAEVVILGVSDGWCQVQRGDQEGYVKADYITVNGIPLADPKGMITGTFVNFRSAPSLDASILTKVSTGTMVELISLVDGWYAVRYDGLEGYVSADYVKVYDGSSVEGSGVGAEAVELALTFVGTPYVYGGSSPSGFDCSGFTMYIYGQLGYSLPHSATSQWYSTGSYVAKDELQPGDLVLFCDPSYSNGKACSHVGMYIGDGQFVHASSSKGGKVVKTDYLSADYYSRYYVGAKRVA